MPIHLRQLPVGTRFVLKRTGQRFRLVRREIATPSGTRYVVIRDGENRESSLHHSCHVKPIITALSSIIPRRLSCPTR